MEFQVLHVLPFDSVRKRMSIILRHPITKERILFCKGADSAMFPRLRRRRQQRPPAATSHHQDDPEAEAEEKTKAQLESYAKLGKHTPSHTYVLCNRFVHVAPRSLCPGPNRPLDTIKHPFDYIFLNLVLEEVYMVSPTTFIVKISKF